MNLLEKVSRGMTWNFFGNFVSLIIGFILSIIIVRLLGPSDYGLLAIIMSMSMLFGILSSFSLESGIIKYVPELRVRGESNKIRDIVMETFFIRSVITLLGCVVLYLIAPFLAISVLKKPEIEFYLKLLSIFLIPGGISGIFRSFLSSMYEQKFLNVMNVATLLIRFLLTVILLYFGYGILGILYVNFLVEVLALVLLGKRTGGYIDFKITGTADITKKAYRYSFVLWLVYLGGFLLGKDLDVLLLSMFWNKEEVGFYNLSFMFVSQAFLIFTMPIGNLGIISASEIYAKKDFRALSKFFMLLCKYIYFFTIPISLGGLILSKNIVAVLFGEEYLPAVMLIQLYLITMALGKVGGAIGTLLAATENQKIMLYGKIFGVVNLILNLILIPKYGAIGAVIGTSISSLITLLYEGIMLSKKINIRLPLGFMFKSSMASIVMIIPIIFIKNLLNSISVLILTVALCSLIYLLMIRFLKLFNEEDIELIKASGMPLKNLIIRLVS